MVEDVVEEVKEEKEMEEVEARDDKETQFCLVVDI